MTLARRRSRGQALVEFALAFPIFMLILMGIIDGGRLVYTDSTLSQAAREAARTGAVEAGWVGISSATDASCVTTLAGVTAAKPGAHVCPPNVASMKADIVAAANRMVVGLGTITTAQVYISCNTGQTGDTAPTGAWTEASGGNGCTDGSGNSVSTPGDLLSVRITYTFTPITPVFNTIGITLGRTSSATMVIN
jgi:hypothetical protein